MTFIPCMMNKCFNFPVASRPDETEQDSMILARPPHSTSSAYILPVENFSQRISLIREVRNAETKENSLRRLSNNIVVIEHSQGPLVLFHGL